MRGKLDDCICSLWASLKLLFSKTFLIRQVYKAKFGFCCKAQWSNMLDIHLYCFPLRRSCAPYRNIYSIIQRCCLLACVVDTHSLVGGGICLSKSGLTSKLATSNRNLGLSWSTYFNQWSFNSSHHYTNGAQSFWIPRCVVKARCNALFTAIDDELRVWFFKERLVTFRLISRRLNWRLHGLVVFSFRVRGVDLCKL